MGMTMCFAIGIIRYKLLDFNIALRNAVVNIGTAVAFSLPLILLFLVIKNRGAYIFLLLLALSVYPLVFKKVAPWLMAVLNAKVFSQFSYFKEFPQIEKELEETFTTGQVAWKLVKPVAEAMKLIGACCLVYDREEDAFLPKAAVGLNEIMIRGSMEFVTLGLENPLIRHLRTTRLPIIYDMIADVPEEVVIREVMDDIEAKVCLPLFVGKRMIAVLGLNRKESSNMFNQEDLSSLQSLCHEAEKRLSQVLFTEYRLRFLGGLAHDLRSPFVKPGRLMDILDSIMSGKYGRLEENLQSAINSAYEDCVDQRRKVELQADISKQLKRFLDAEQPVAEFNLKPMLEQIIQRNLTEAKIKNIYLLLEYADNIPLVLANEEDVERIINNLVENAVKFTLAGGVTIKVNKNTDELLIAVKDTGPGITEGDKKKVMKYGGQGETVDKSKGLGLGLAIVKELAESNGARFWYETVSGQGSTFFVGITLIERRVIRDIA
ncbi:MAG: HAMP domain-containing sensor histidine kinase [Elusimicrobiota bacterium]